MQVDVLEIEKEATGPECEKITIMTGDKFGITTGEPFDGGADGDCRSTSAEGPPEFSNSLNITACRPAGSIGTECDVSRGDCDFPARLEVDLLGQDEFDVGASREATYRVSLKHAHPGCARISCSSEYRVQVTRID